MLIRKNFFFLIITLSLASRIFVIHAYGDQYIQMEWGEIFSAYKKFGIFGREINGEVVPNLYMPPLYPMFLILLDSLFPFESNFQLFVLYVQIILSIISILYFYRTLKFFFSENLSLLGTSIFAFLPLNIYSVSQSSSTCLQLFLLVLFFYFFIKFRNKENLKDSLLFSIFSSGLILIRGEFILTYFLTILYIFIVNKKLKYLLISVLICLVTISPYIVRNYNITNKVIITKSLGFNLWKGNNMLSKVEGNDKIYDKNMSKEYENLIRDDLYDVNMDNIYKKKVIENFQSDPKRYLFLYFKKFFSFMFFDIESSRPNYYNILHLIPKIILSIFSFIGLVFLFKKYKNTIDYFAYFYLYNISLFSFFFILPRYSLMLLPVQIILMCYVVKKLKPNI